MNSTSTSSPPAAQTRRVRLIDVTVVKWVACSLLGAGVLLAVAFFYSKSQFGSVSSALLYLRGERLYVDLAAARTEMEADNRKRIEVTVYNYTGKPARLLGYETTRGCRVEDVFPIEIPADSGKQLTLHVNVKPASESKVRGAVTLFTDYPPRSRLPVIFPIIGKCSGSCPIE